MTQYHFDETIDRTGTNCLKYDMRREFFGREDVIPMWVADMDFKTPDFILEAIRNRMNHELLGYTFRGDSYYQSIITWLQRRHNWAVKKEWISFSPGVVAGLTMAIETFSNPGDGVIVQPPVYFPFFDSVKGTGRRMIENPLRLENGRYRFDMDDLRAKTDDNTRMLLLCNPQNPGGMAWSPEELTELGTFCMERNILIVSDEIHSDLIFRPHRHTPLASLSPELAANTVTLMSASKTFNTAGLTTSFVVISDKRRFVQYERTLRTPHLHMGNIFGNIALEAAYTKGEFWLEELLSYLKGNIDYLRAELSASLPSIRMMEPESTYLAWLDFSGFGLSDDEVWSRLLEAGVGLSRGTQFGKEGKGYMRMNIGCPKSILTEALNRIKEAFYP